MTGLDRWALGMMEKGAEVSFRAGFPGFEQLPRLAGWETWHPPPHWVHLTVKWWEWHPVDGVVGAPPLAPRPLLPCSLPLLLQLLKPRPCSRAAPTTARHSALCPDWKETRAPKAATSLANQRWARLPRLSPAIKVYRRQAPCIQRRPWPSPCASQGPRDSPGQEYERKLHKPLPP